MVVPALCPYLPSGCVYIDGRKPSFLAVANELKRISFPVFPSIIVVVKISCNRFPFLNAVAKKSGTAVSSSFNT